MTEIQVAWIAGLVEGEGCISVGSCHGWQRASVSVAMTDYDVILRLQQWSGVGCITAARRIAGKKQAWVWTVNKQVDLADLLSKIFPFLCSRRQAKAQSALDLLNEKMQSGGLGRGRFHRSKTQCRNGHIFSDENTYTSKRGTRCCRICRRESVKRWVTKDPEKARLAHRDGTRRFRERQKAKQKVE